MEVICVKDLSFRYKGAKRHVLRNITLGVESGEAVAITGPSGCGKSTLLYCMSGIIPHSFAGKLSGEVLLFGEKVAEMPLSAVSRRLGIVFQNPETQLFSSTVEDEVAFGPENMCLEKAEIACRIEEALELVGMRKYRRAAPSMLSGGQKQLVALAAVLSLHPQVLLFDEALSQLDSAGKALIKQGMRNLKKEGKTIVMVDHDDLNLDIADRVIRLPDLYQEKGSGFTTVTSK